MIYASGKLALDHLGLATGRWYRLRLGAGGPKSLEGFGATGHVVFIFCDLRSQMPLALFLRIKSKIPAGVLPTSQTFSPLRYPKPYPRSVLGRAARSCMAPRQLERIVSMHGDFSPQQHRILCCDQRFIMLVAGRRWGKTTLGLFKLRCHAASARQLFRNARSASAISEAKNGDS